LYSSVPRSSQLPSIKSFADMSDFNAPATASSFEASPALIDALS